MSHMRRYATRIHAPCRRRRATTRQVASEAWGAVLGTLREHGGFAQRAEGVQALLVQPGRDAARVVRVPAEWQRLDLATPPTTSQTALLLYECFALTHTTHGTCPHCLGSLCNPVNSQQCCA